MRKFLLLCLVLVSLRVTGQTEFIDYGSVAGMVVEQDGTPLADAIVFGLPEEDMRHQLRTTTDKSGRFVLNHIPSGWIYLDAFKEEAGYPYNFFAFFKIDNKTPVKVSIEANKALQGVRINLGLRAASLHLEITDQQGTPISTCRLIFTRSDQPGNFKTNVPESRSLLVPAVPFHLVVEAPSFVPWESLITPKPSQALHISVRLQPVKSVP